ncbi:unnamed protein product, partial [Symbiodinium pilosum]
AQPYNTFDTAPGYEGKGQEFLGLAGAPQKKRLNLNALAVILNMLLPWTVFSAICWALSFSLHYKAPWAAWGSVALGIGIVAWSARLAMRADASEKWHSFFTVATLVAVLMATACGEWNYRTYNSAVYDLNNMNAYPAVSPAGHKGQQMMDAGRVYFKEGTSLDLKKAMSFKNSDTYCVAPITFGQDQMPSYDYWAIGMNCCEGQTPDFRCSEYNNAHARAGLRLMSDDERPFYRLAVQQAEAAYNIRAEHPMFFHWVQDPVALMSAWTDAATRFVMMSSFCFFVLNFFCVSCAVVVFSKMGGY